MFVCLPKFALLLGDLLNERLDKEVSLERAEQLKAVRLERALIEHGWCSFLNDFFTSYEVILCASGISLLQNR